jgi:hypothetical protein
MLISRDIGIESKQLKQSVPLDRVGILCPVRVIIEKVSWYFL